MVFSELISWLDARLKDTLPGLNAQLRMSSMARIRELTNFSVPSHARKSGVLLLLYPVDNERICFVLMKRPDYDGVHSGQISIPGGKYEESDPNLVATALREAEEEVGIQREKVIVIGSLTPLYIPPSNFLVMPAVGYQPEKPSFLPDPAEVDEIIEIYLDEFMDDTNIMQKDAKISLGFSLPVPCYYIRNKMIWGATAMILSEFREILQEFTKGK